MPQWSRQDLASRGFDAPLTPVAVCARARCLGVGGAHVDGSGGLRGSPVSLNSFKNWAVIVVC